MRAALVVAAVGLAVSSALADWTATGRFEYRDRVFSRTGFSGEEPTLPVRHADVEVLDADSGSVLALGATDATGAYAIAVVDAAVRTVYVRAVTRSNATPDLHLRVTTIGGTLYASATAEVESHHPSTNLDFGTQVAEIGQGGEAFNLYDGAVLGIDYVAFVDGARPGASDLLTVLWAVDGGTVASSASPTTVRIRDNGPYDDTVLLHEFGHFVVFNYGDTDNPAGSHALADCAQDPRLAWEEGHATLFGNSVRRHFGMPDSHLYVRTTGGPGPGHLVFALDLETETTYNCHGITSEVAVATALWDVLDDPETPDDTPGEDDAPHDSIARPDLEHWRALTDGIPGRTFITTEDWWDAWFEPPVLNGFVAEMVAATTPSGVENTPDVYEPNESLAGAEPASADGSSRHATFFLDPDGNGSGGGLFDEDWFAFQTYAGSSYTVETTDLLSAADTEISIYDATGSRKARNDDRASGDPSSLLTWVAPVAATYYVRVRQPGNGAQNTTPYGSFNLRIAVANDADGDAIPAPYDLCPDVADPGQEDYDGDGVGDACDGDRDDDGVANESDCAPLVPTVSGLPEPISRLRLVNDKIAWDDTTETRVFDLYRAMGPFDDAIPPSAACAVAGQVVPYYIDPELPAEDRFFGYLVAGANRCGSGPLGSVAIESGSVFCASAPGADTDGDGVADLDDRCPAAGDPLQVDTDGDGAGDACDVCPSVPDPTQADEDLNGTGDACEE